jgi:hypothetical protein
MVEIPVGKILSANPAEQPPAIAPHPAWAALIGINLQQQPIFSNRRLTDRYLASP